MTFKTWHLARDSNPDQRFWRPTCCHYTSEIKLVPLDNFEMSAFRLSSECSSSELQRHCFPSAAVIIVRKDMTLSYLSHVPSTRFPTKKNSRIANATSVRVVPHLSNELTSLPACHSSQALPWLVLEGDERIKLPLQGS